MVWFVALMYATWASVFAFGKIVLASAPPVFITSSRMILAGVLMLGYVFFRRKISFKLSWRQWLSIGLLSIFSIYLTNILEFWSLQHLTAAKTCFIYSLSPFFAALFSYLHFKEKMNLPKWIGMLIGFVGIVPVLTMQTGAEELLNAFSFFSWPTLAMMGAALFSVYGWILLRIVVKEQEISPIMANGCSMLLGGTLALINSFIVDTWDPTPIHSGKMFPFIGGILGMTFLYNIICYNVYGLLLKRFTATFMSFMGLLSPVFASLLGWLFLGETLSWQILLATTVVSLGLWIIYRAELKQGYIQKSLKPAKNV